MWSMVVDRRWRRRAALAALACLALGTAALSPWLGRSLSRAASFGASAPSNAPLAQPVETVPVAQRVLALTFDISWGTVMPPKVVAILEREKVPATFFLSGPWVVHHADFVRAMAQVPYFELESHGQAHVNFSSLGYEGVVKNLTAASDALYQVTGRRPTMVRPPNGDYSRLSLRATASLGMRTILWGTDSWDWMNPGVDVIVRRVLSRAHPGDIVLLHASDTCKQTDQALPRILSGLRAQGYRFVTVGQLLRMASPPKGHAQASA